MLVDFGTTPNSIIPSQDPIKSIAEKVAARKTAEIDILVVTHSDRDHWNRLPALVEGIQGLKFGCIFTGGRHSEYLANPELKKLFEDNGNWHGVPVRDLKARPVTQQDPATPHDADPGSFVVGAFTPEDHPLLTIGGVNVYLLAANTPSVPGRRIKPNSSSIVLLLEFGKSKVILTGDAEADVEKAILQRFSKEFLKSGALKLGHHGSKAATSPDWIAAVRPEVIYASADQRYSHPYCEVFSRFNDHDIKKEDIKYEGKLAKVTKHPMLCGTTPQVNYSQLETESAKYTNIFYDEYYAAGHLRTWGTEFLLEAAADGRMQMNWVNMIWNGATIHQPQYLTSGEIATVRSDDENSGSDVDMK